MPDRSGSCGLSAGHRGDSFTAGRDKRHVFQSPNRVRPPRCRHIWRSPTPRTREGGKKGYSRHATARLWGHLLPLSRLGGHRGLLIGEQTKRSWPALQTLDLGGQTFLIDAPGGTTQHAAPVRLFSASERMVSESLIGAVSDEPHVHPRYPAHRVRRTRWRRGGTVKALTHADTLQLLFFSLYWTQDTLADEMGTASGSRMSGPTSSPAFPVHTAIPWRRPRSPR